MNSTSSTSIPIAPSETLGDGVQDILVLKEIRPDDSDWSSATAALQQQERDGKVGDPHGRKAVTVNDQPPSQIAAIQLSSQANVQLLIMRPATIAIGNIDGLAAGSDTPGNGGGGGGDHVSHHEKGTRHKNASCYFFATLCTMAMCLFATILPYNMSKRGGDREDAEPTKACGRPAQAMLFSRCRQHSAMTVVTIALMVLTHVAVAGATTMTATSHGAAATKGTSASSLLRGGRALVNSSFLHEAMSAFGADGETDAAAFKSILALKGQQSNNTVGDKALTKKRQEFTAAALVDEGKGLSASGSHVLSPSGKQVYCRCRCRCRCVLRESTDIFGTGDD